MADQPWYERPLDRRAPAGGEEGVDGKFYKGGEVEPFYVPRPEMPQIHHHLIADFVEFAKGKGVEVVFRTAVDPKTLKFHQRVGAVDPAQMTTDKLKRPVFASADEFILDGNHRVDAHILYKKPVDVWQVMLEFEAAIALMFSFPGCVTVQTAE